MLSTREWLTFLPTNTTSRKWLATPLRHDVTLTKNYSDVSRPTDAFRNILCQVAQPCVSPSLISLHTYFMVTDTLTKNRTDVLRPTVVFRSFVDAKLFNRFLFTIQARMPRLSCCLPLNKTRGFSDDCLHARHLLITQRFLFVMTLHYRHLHQCFSSYGRVSQHLPALPCLLILCPEIFSPH
jgi:hypothetical protein